MQLSEQGHTHPTIEQHSALTSDTLPLLRHYRLTHFVDAVGMIRKYEITVRKVKQSIHNCCKTFLYLQKFYLVNDEVRTG